MYTISCCTHEHQDTIILRCVITSKENKEKKFTAMSPFTCSAAVRHPNTCLFNHHTQRNRCLALVNLISAFYFSSDLCMALPPRLVIGDRARPFCHAGVGGEMVLQARGGCNVAKKYYSNRTALWVDKSLQRTVTKPTTCLTPSHTLTN